MSRDEQATIVAPEARTEEKTGAYLRFLGWASLNMPGFWRLRLEILIVGYVVLFFGAIGTPLIFAGMSGSRDHGFECDDYRWDQEVENAIKAGRDAPQISYRGDPEYKRIVSESKVPCAGAIRDPYAYATTPEPAYTVPAPEPAPADPVAPVDSAAPAAAPETPPADVAAPAEPAPVADYSYTEPYRSVSEYYVWTGGFNSGEQGLILTIFIILSSVFALVWSFFVTRGTRLRDVIGKTNAPGFATCVLALTPLVLFPILAGHISFAVSHGDVMTALLQGKAAVRKLSGDGMEIYFPGSVYNNSFSLLVLIFGGIIVLLLAAILKIIMYDGVIGLLRTGVMALALAVPAITLAVVLYGALLYSSSTESTFVLVIITFMLLAFLVVLWLLYRKDLIKGVRRRMTRPLALTFLILWPIWFGFACIVAFAYYLERTGYPSSSEYAPLAWGYFITCFVVGVLIEAQLFRGIARISLLPRP